MWLNFLSVAFKGLNNALTSTQTQITPSEVENWDELDENTLKEMALAEATRIFEKLDEVDHKIAEAHELVREAENFRNRGVSERLWEKLPFATSPGEKIGILNAKAATALAEAIAEQNEIIRESIAFTQFNSRFSQAMVTALSSMLENGFEDVNGRHSELSEDSEIIVEQILQQAEQFIEMETNLVKFGKDIDELKEFKNTIDENTTKLEKELDEFEKNHAFQKEQIAANTEAIKKLEAKTQSKISLYTSILALLVSLASLVLHFV
ncbi:hypothetical protein CQA38_03195 [Campylobacter sp. MIT 12-5580]|uniref:hypothetical protein n=1 Tax=Campylobacter sp. MIT 12-5580 TaxID=2040651 RepID=UPI0010F7A030|nr:hypothetical protein [Campylobacter sp. MIT 12-5580]TKX29791.1 hypothetical protein CQA38_03195 [Campylobacter sp. MIT 12-5580]